MMIASAMMKVNGWPEAVAIHAAILVNRLRMRAERTCNDFGAVQANWPISMAIEAAAITAAAAQPKIMSGARSVKRPMILG